MAPGVNGVGPAEGITSVAGLEEAGAELSGLILGSKFLAGVWFWG